MIARVTPVMQASVSPRTFLIRAGTHVFWTNPATGVAGEVPAYVSDWPMDHDDGASIPSSSVSPPNRDASSSPALCEGHLWIG
jgi:hypothetical protein